MIAVDVSDYKCVGCPKCGAKHKFFNAHDMIECYCCYFMFYAVDARLYEEYKK